MNHTFPPPSPNSEDPVTPPPCQCPPAQSIPFLDTDCSIRDSQIVTDLYRKPTHRNQYVLTIFCHPAHVTDNIPFSLALRIIRICSENTGRDIRLAELKSLLLYRGYKEKSQISFPDTGKAPVPFLPPTFSNSNWHHFKNTTSMRKRQLI